MRARVLAVFATLALLTPLAADRLASASSGPTPRARPTIVLLHGDWADASSWNEVIPDLQRRGYHVVAPPNPLRGPTSDAAYVASYLQSIQGPIVLVAHSYGGFVATNAARGNPNVRALVYIDAFVPDAGQTLGELTAGSCVDADNALDVVPGPDGVLDAYLHLEPRRSYPGYAECFANGLNRADVDALAATQRPAALAQFVDPSGPPAWATIPSWSLIGTLDRVIPPATQRAMSTRAGAEITTVRAGHLSLITQSTAVVRMIEQAVAATD